MAARRLPPQVFFADALIMCEGPTAPYQIVVQVEGEPRVQERHRIGRVKSGGKARMYDPSGPLKKLFKRAVSEALEDIDFTYHDLPLFLGAGIYLKVDFGVRDMTKDIDNLLKFVMDALKGVVYEDDSHVLEVHGKKIPAGGFDEYIALQIEKYVPGA
jgi:Holliday junction resolvase RusA-like endonuclease